MDGHGRNEVEARAAAQHFARDCIQLVRSGIATSGVDRCGQQKSAIGAAGAPTDVLVIAAACWLTAKLHIKWLAATQKEGASIGQEADSGPAWVWQRVVADVDRGH